MTKFAGNLTSNKTLKFFDLVEFKIAQLMFKVRNNLLPGHIKKMFFEREGGYTVV